MLFPVHYKTSVEFIDIRKSLFLFLNKQSELSIRLFNRGRNEQVAKPTIFIGLTTPVKKSTIQKFLNIPKKFDICIFGLNNNFSNDDVN